ncbi:MAG: thiamine pyrophosphate-binding protein, partial [Ktedonobacteraceae bacterium]
MGKFVARDVIFDYLRALDIDYLFGVPGTNEIPIIDGTSKDGPKTDGLAPLVDGIHYIPCLHENIAMGAAMGYARMSGKPGVVMLHVTPGIGHALGNLFNAYKSHIPVLILCGQQHSRLILQEPLLASDTVRVAEQYTKWAYEVRVPEELPLVMQRALKLAITPPMGPVFISVPWDYTIQPIPGYKPGSAQITRISTNVVGAPDALLATASILKGSTDRHVPPVIIVGDGVGATKAWDELQMVAQKTGAYVFAEGLSSMMNYPPEDYHYKGELPPLQEKMQEAILHPSGHIDTPQTEVVFLCGFNAQAQIVAYDYNHGQLIPEEIKHVLYLHNDPWEIGKNRYGEVAILGDIKLSLARLAELLPENLPGAKRNNESIQAFFMQSKEHFHAYMEQIDQKKSLLPKGEETIPGLKIAEALGELQKERSLQLVLINEAISDAGAFQNQLHYTEPTSYF